MKKVSVMAVAVALVIFCSAIYGWSQAAPAAPPAQVDVKAFRQFQKETLPLRDELMAKRMELRNEYAQPTPNLDKIAGLEKEMIDLRTKIQVAAQKQGLPAMGRGWMAGQGGFGREGWHHGPGRGGQGGGRGFGGGQGYGNCPMWN
jgi:zinc resistance-associated protein